MVVNEVGALSLGTAICIPIPQTPPRVCPTGSGYSSPDSFHPELKLMCINCRNLSM